MLPSGTIRTEGELVCASVQAFQPCFNLDKTDPVSFRGSIAACASPTIFTRRNTRPNVLRSPRRPQP